VLLILIFAIGMAGCQRAQQASFFESDEGILNIFGDENDELGWHT